jgi:hypothetical protein
MAKKKQHKRSENKVPNTPPSDQDFPDDPIYGWEPDWESFEVRSYRQPSPYEIASLSIALAKRGDPRKHLKEAYDLYWDSYSMLREEWKSGTVSTRGLLRCLGESNNPKNYVLFERAEGWDEAREYLNDHGYRLQTAKAVLKNLQPVWIDLEHRKDSPGQAEWRFAQLKKDPALKLKKTHLDEMVRRYKAKKSAGGKKSHVTRKRGKMKIPGEK